MLSRGFVALACCSAGQLAFLARDPDGDTDRAERSDRSRDTGEGLRLCPTVSPRTDTTSPRAGPVVRRPT
jgi:hypothetical protein